jgi:hypothetical protein
MFFALVGGTIALLTLSRVHDRQVGALPRTPDVPPHREAA